MGLARHTFHGQTIRWGSRQRNLCSTAEGIGAPAVLIRDIPVVLLVSCSCGGVADGHVGYGRW